MTIEAVEALAALHPDERILVEEALTEEGNDLVASDDLVVYRIRERGPGMDAVARVVGPREGFEPGDQVEARGPTTVISQVTVGNGGPHPEPRIDVVWRFVRPGSPR